MGTRRAKAKEAGARAATSFVQTVGPLGGVTSRSMFGGHGIFRDDIMFAIVDSEGRLYLRADATTAAAFEAAGSTQHARMPYWEVPDEVADDPETLREWAEAAADVAARRH